MRMRRLGSDSLTHPRDRKRIRGLTTQTIGWTLVTPADLAELLKSTAAAVLTEHGLDTSALPATVTVERPRNPEHGDYATNIALQLGKKVGANPRELAGWLPTPLPNQVAVRP